MKVVEKETKKGVKYSLEVPETLEEATKAYGSEVCLQAIIYWISVKKSRELNAPPKAEALSPEMKKALKDPAVLAMMQKILDEKAKA